MDDYIREDQHLTSLVITTLSIVVVILLGIIGYAYLTKDITPKNKIVQFFSSDKLSFEDLPLLEQERYTLKSNSLEVLESFEEEPNQVVEVIEEAVQEEKPNKFLEKMAKMQKDTDEMTLEEKTIAPVITEEEKSENKFLKKMAKMQKDTDEILIEGKTISAEIEKEKKPQNKFLEKMAKKQKDTDDMIIKGNENSY